MLLLFPLLLGRETCSDSRVPVDAPADVTATVAVANEDIGLETRGGVCAVAEGGAETFDPSSLMPVVFLKKSGVGIGKGRGIGIGIGIGIITGYGTMTATGGSNDERRGFIIGLCVGGG